MAGKSVQMDITLIEGLMFHFEDPVISGQGQDLNVRDEQRRACLGQVAIGHRTGEARAHALQLRLAAPKRGDVGKIWRGLGPAKNPEARHLSRPVV